MDYLIAGAVLFVCAVGLILSNPVWTMTIKQGKSEAFYVYIAIIELLAATGMLILSKELWTTYALGVLGG
jgi:hypothetical protein